MPLTLLLHGRHAPQMAYEPFGPWLVPWRFTDTRDEYRRLRNTTGVLDASVYAAIEVRGDDRADFLHRLLTNDIKRLAPGTGCRAALLTSSAKLVADLLVLADTDVHWLLCELPYAETVRRALEHYLFTEAVSLIAHERRLAALAFPGPQAMALASRLAGTPLLSLASPGDHVQLPLHDEPARWIRWSPIGGEGLLCLVEAARVAALWERLVHHDAVAPIGWEALNIARIEAGAPWMGIDMTEENLLPDTGLDESIASETKGCYIGQEIVARMRTYGSPNKRLMGLLLEDSVVPSSGDELLRGGEAVGRVTSACRSIVLDRVIAMGYVKRGADEPGTAVEVARGDQRLVATVAARPLTLPASSGRTRSDA
ncbi:MAG: hypothetical protein COV75_05205 [Candidatus Omnitrophica bacterium CG11_big_fil_rev_8_21_14_0_20_63_9]|nr:MAG: hypothetical protein COV75_05205 [Candidatus Omnitrophica bacterium CG11_big_fil_rev_8_21_14_0_20_63_9]